MTGHNHDDDGTLAADCSACGTRVRTTRRLAFVDLETTGLDPFTHHAYEVAWAIDDYMVRTVWLPHTLEAADPRALEIGGYWRRGFYPWTPAEVDRGVADFRVGKLVDLRRELRDVTLVGANPAFDSVFLRKALGVSTWHYRMIDVEQMAQWILKWPEPKGLWDVCAWLGDLGHDIPEPDHTAAGDVAATRACYHALRSYS